MKVLLTGANGFVGSRVLDRLLARGIPTVVLLRSSAARRLIQPALDRVEVRTGALEDASSLDAALQGSTHVIHCAGKTKALDASEYHEVNAGGTRRLVEAINRCGASAPRLVHLSSLAACGPGTPAHPAREAAEPAPVSEYGRSKLAAEQAVRTLCRREFVILRPPGVYGPGDRDFLQLFRAARARIRPSFGGGGQPLNLVYADDLADVAVECLSRPEAAGETFNVAHPDLVTARGLARQIAAVLGVRAIPLPLPGWTLPWLGALGEVFSRVTGRPGILSRDRSRELSAAGWVCDVGRLRERLGLSCPTPLEVGVARTLAWYRVQGWL